VQKNEAAQKQKSLGVTSKPALLSGCLKQATKDKWQMANNELLTLPLTSAPQLTPQVINSVATPPGNSERANHSRAINYDDSVRRTTAGKEAGS